MNRYLSITTLFVLLGAVNAPAQDLRGEDLVANSPFLPPNWGAGGDNRATSAQNSGDLEFRGVYQLGGEYFFNVYNKAMKKGTWVRLNEEVEGLRVTRYSHDSDSIALHVNGSSRDLSMAKPSDAVIAVQLAANTAASRPQGNVAADSGSQQNRVIRRSGNSRVMNRSIPPPPPPPPSMRQNSGPPTAPTGAIRPPPGIQSSSSSHTTPTNFQRTQTNTPAPGRTTGSRSQANTPAPGRSTGSPAENPGGWTPPKALQDGPPDFIPGDPPGFTPQLPSHLRDMIEQRSNG